MYKLFGLLDPLAGARVETALDAAARKLRRGEHPDARATVPQRYADALEALATGGGGAQATTLVVIADYDALTGRVGAARLPDGTPVTAEELVGLCVKANAVPAVFDTAGRPLWLGRASRDANAAQRLALAARDGGCVGCGARHNTCEPHHEQHWRHGGGTDIDNLCLLCGPCHHHEIHRLGGDIAFLELPGQARHLPATLEPGFTLVGWTGTDGLRISRATEGLPVWRAYQWDGVSQRYRVWDPRVSEGSRDDFPLEYGSGLWIDVRGSAPVDWHQR